MYSYKFLTIKPKNYDDFEYGKKHIRESFRKFIRRKYIKERVKGGFYVIEVTNHGKGWNFHIHCILFSRVLSNTYRGKCSCGQSYLKKDRFTNKLYCASRQCNKIFEGEFEKPRLVQEWEASSKRSCFMDISWIRNRDSVINYSLKYVTSHKDSFDNIEDFAYFIKNTYREKLINSFGEFSGVSAKYGNSYIPYSLFKKNNKKVCICPDCNSVIKYQFDLEISQLVNSLDPFGSVPPDTNTLSYWEQ